MKSFFDLPQRLQDKIMMCPVSGCWNWTGYINKKGYGGTRHPRLKIVKPTHRVTYEILIGIIPDGLQIDHLCRNRGCCNPAHLEAVTPHENWRRGNGPCAVHARKTHCYRGHEFNEDNTDVQINSRTGRHRRFCKRCRSRVQHLYYLRKTGQSTDTQKYLS